MADVTFFASVRSALTHLYDPDYLRRSNLAVVLDVAGKFDAPSVLQRILVSTVEAVKPAPGSAGFDEMSELHELLTYRYVQQFGQEEVAHQLGVSVRHLRRRQNAAIYLVASALWAQYDLGQSGLLLDADSDAPQSDALRSAEAPQEADDESDEVEGLAWLAGSSRLERTDARSALAAVLVLYLPLAQLHGVRLVVQSDQEGIVAVHPVAFQQMLLQLLSVATPYALHDDLHLSCAFSSAEAHFAIDGAGLWQPGNAEREALAVTESVITMCGGRLHLGEAGMPFRAEVSFPAARTWNVAVIEDNHELVEVMQRYTEGTRYHIVPLEPLPNVVAHAEAVQPDVIVIDIMMPEIDGLQVLTEVKQSAILGRVPVVVSSVLPQGALASALGAAAFVAKPFKQAAFLEALAHALAGTPT